MATAFTLTRQNPTTGTITARAFADDGTAYAVASAVTGTHPLFRVTRAALGLLATDTGYVIWYEDATAISHEGFRAEERGTDGANTVTPPTAQGVWEYADRKINGIAEVSAETVDSTFTELVATATKTKVEEAGSKLSVLYTDWLDGGRLDELLDDSASTTVVVPTIVAEDIVAGDTTTRYRGTQWTLTINDIGDEPTKIACTVKRRDEADADAVLQVILSIPSDAEDGLVRLNGDTPDDATYGSIAISTYEEDATTKRRAVATIEAAATQYVSQGTYKFDFKDLGTPEVLGTGVLKVLADVTRAIE